MTEFPNLIIEANVLVDIDELTEHPENWRRHSDDQRDALRVALAEGTAANILVNRRSGRIINGHLRYELARELEHAQVTVDYVDVDEDLERRLLVRLDSLSLMADIDTAALIGLIDVLDDSEIILHEVLIGMIEIEDLTQSTFGTEPRPRLQYLEEGQSNDAGGCAHRWTCDVCGATRT